MREDIKYLIKNGKYEEAIAKLEGVDTLNLIEEKYKRMYDLFNSTPDNFEEMHQKRKEVLEIIEKYPPNNKNEIRAQLSNLATKVQFFSDMIEDCIEGDDYDIQIVTGRKNRNYSVVFYSPVFVIKDTEKFKKAIHYCETLDIAPHMTGVIIMDILYVK